ncbi:unnamed protein product [Gongylonema pulchrum]|uniref:IL4Ra_N domain-containing protein n=1 Tax=Gongylonema pulchrum TaxID=637853 RepID=A0A183EGQ2_9BILA|nr:unnamed protein product [Gongylonema pulchrum]
MFFLSFIIISLAPALFNAAPISPLPPETPVNNPPTVHFWITTEILNVDWTPKCLTTAYCDEPELKITQTNTWNGEKSSFSWVLNENFEQSIEIALEVAGTDPKYHFQRICDQSSATKPFASDVQVQNSGEINSTNAENSKGRMIVELRGRCFDASLTVQEHIGRCPWCIELEKTTHPSTTKVSDSISQEINEQLLLLCALLGAILLCTCITLLGFCIWKCKSKQKKPKAKSPTVIVHSPSWDHDHFV